MKLQDKIMILFSYLLQNFTLKYKILNIFYTLCPLLMSINKNN
ncbi:hypothetical protein cypCar_00041566 [Cyprinus carpio]|nr:hypothetical protein cypCar_00041566 [Cyprinus carpio]